jgi:hypothetical protein
MLFTLCSSVASIFVLQAALFPPIEVRGHVYKPDGSPAAYATVQAIDPHRAAGSMSIGFTYVDRAGNFVLGLPAYGRYDIIASEPANSFSVAPQANGHTTLDLRYGEIQHEINLRLH